MLLLLSVDSSRTFHGLVIGRLRANVESDGGELGNALESARCGGGRARKVCAGVEIVNAASDFSTKRAISVGEARAGVIDKVRRDDGYLQPN